MHRGSQRLIQINGHLLVATLAHEIVAIWFTTQVFSLQQLKAADLGVGREVKQPGKTAVLRLKETHMICLPHASTF